MIRPNSIYNFLMQIPAVFENFMGNLVTKGFINLLLGAIRNLIVFLLKICSCILYVVRSVKDTDPHSAGG